MTNNPSALELAKKIDAGERPELENDLSKEAFDLLKRLRHIFQVKYFISVAGMSMFLINQQIHKILEFSKNTGFQLPDN